MTNLNQIIKMIPGITLCLFIAIPAWILGRIFPIIGGPVLGIVFGIIISMVFSDLTKMKLSLKGKGVKKIECTPEDGIKYTSKTLLQYSIILLGFEMNLFHIIKVGNQSILIILSTLTGAFITAYLVGKSLKIEGKTAILIGVGTSICGGSAIAATAPIIKADADDIAHAISTIFLFNIAAVFLFPALGHFIGMTDNGFGIWAGTAINDTSSVVASATMWSDISNNNTALSTATVVKLTRTLFIIPISFILAIYISRKDKLSSDNHIFRLSKIFPWFIIGFLVASIINTVLELPVQITSQLTMAGKFMIVMAMCAIGINSNIKKLCTNGIKPIILGLSCWFVVSCLSLAVQTLMELI